MSDRELDTKMAELMGWIYWDSDFRDYDGEYPMYIVLDALLLVYDEANKHREFSPSTDIAAAMQVVEKLREMGYTTLRLSTGGSLGDRWQCHCADKWRQTSREGDKDYFANADILPEAICRAALLAAEEE